VSDRQTARSSAFGVGFSIPEKRYISNTGLTTFFLEVNSCVGLRHEAGPEGLERRGKSKTSCEQGTIAIESAVVPRMHASPVGVEHHDQEIGPGDRIIQAAYRAREVIDYPGIE